MPVLRVPILTISAFRRAELFHYGANVIFGDLDHQQLDRFAKLAVDLLHNDLRTGNLELKVLHGALFQSGSKGAALRARKP